MTIDLPWLLDLKSAFDRRWVARIAGIIGGLSDLLMTLSQSTDLKNGWALICAAPSRPSRF